MGGTHYETAPLLPTNININNDNINNSSIATLQAHPKYTHGYVIKMIEKEKDKTQKGVRNKYVLLSYAPITVA